MKIDSQNNLGVGMKAKEIEELIQKHIQTINSTREG
jgi:hypothetical protein